MGWKQIVCITTLALLVGQSESQTTAATATKEPTTSIPPTTGPPINYTCSMDGTIKINTANLMATSHRIAISQARDEASVLQYTKADQTKCQYAELLNNQDITLKNCSTNSPIYVYLMNQTSTIIVGGKNNHAYELNCYFPEDGIQMEVSVAPIHVNSPAAYSNETHAFDLGDIGLTMTITPQSIHLGDKLSLSISSDKKDLYVLPMNCTATEGGTGNGIQELLTNGKAVDVNLLEDFNITKKGSAVAAMYAFRFESSEKVKVTCTVTICQTKDCGGAYTQSSTRRRRRSVEETAAGRTYDVSAAFEILDNEPNESSSSSTLVQVNPLLTGLSLLCLWAVASSKTS